MVCYGEQKLKNQKNQEELTGGRSGRKALLASLYKIIKLEIKLIN